MQRHLQRLVPGWVGVAGAISAVLAVSALSGCPGTLDPSVAKMVTGGSNGSGGDGSGSGGSTGSGGSGSGGNSSGGSTGSGGSSANCTGNLDGVAIVMSQCAVSTCHNTADAQADGAGLDLTVNSTISSRLVDVVSPGDTAGGSQCGGNTEAYLNSGSSPATGLLIQKIKSSPKCSSSETPPCCGLPMPYPGVTLLSTQQQNCLIQWATTLTSP